MTFQLRKRLLKPQYLFRPSQIRRRLNPSDTVELPWGKTIRVNPQTMVGSSLARTGAYDPPVAQALMCLTDHGDVAIDVGANIGYMASVFAARTDRVLAIEPHPEVYERLHENVAPDVKTLRLALSNKRGQGYIGDYDADNDATAQLSNEGHPVELKRLDDLVPFAGVVKIDVEGHEREVLEGAGDLLGRRIRDIVYEEIEPAGATELLRDAGYTIFGLKLGLLRAELVSEKPDNWDPPSYLATLEPERAKRRMRKLWQVF